MTERPNAIACIDRAYKSMVNLLFKPFSLPFWLKLSFIAWLAMLGGGGGNIPGNIGDWSALRNNKDTTVSSEVVWDDWGDEEVSEFIETESSSENETAPVATSTDDEEEMEIEVASSDKPYDHPVPPIVGKISHMLESLRTLIAESDGTKIFFIIALLFFVIVIPVVLVITVIMTYLRSRGAFMFIDSLANCDDISLTDRWALSKKSGNSYFKFAIIAIIAIIMVLIALASPLFFLIPSQIKSDAVYYALASPLFFLIPSPYIIDDTYGPLLVIYIVFFLIAMCCVFYVIILLGMLDAFGTLYMYKTGASAIEAYRRMRRLLAERFADCLVYFIAITILKIGTMFAFVIVSCALCCIPLIISSLPYVWMVMLLPVYVFLRYFSMYYATGFGEEFNVFPPDEQEEESEIIDAQYDAMPTSEETPNY